MARIGWFRTVTGDRVIAGIVLVGLAAVAALVVGDVRNGTPATPSVAVVRQPRNTAEPAVAAAYRYPLGCLSEALSGIRPPVAGGDLGRTGPCWRYGVYVTAVLHSVGRVWRLGLEAVSRSCPDLSLPRFVRAQVVVCRRP